MFCSFTISANFLRDLYTKQTNGLRHLPGEESAALFSFTIRLLSKTFSNQAHECAIYISRKMLLHAVLVKTGIGREKMACAIYIGNVSL